MTTPSSAGFSVQSVVQRGPAALRVRFTTTPLAAKSPGDLSYDLTSHDALTPGHYSLSGPTLNTITDVWTVPDYPQEFDLVTEVPLAAGPWILTVSDQVQTAPGEALQAPRSVSFTAEALLVGEDVTGGAKNDSAEALIRKHLPSSMVGRAWNALITALAVGDRMNWDNAVLAFDQLFKSTASGAYLDRKASDDGLTRPPDIGMPDDLFRQLAIKTTAAKLTSEVILEIMEVFYGSDAVRASVATDLAEPFSLSAGDTLELLLDGRDAYSVAFTTTDFAIISQARAAEVAAAITRTLRQNRSKGFAVAFQDPVTNLLKVRIYSGSLGLGSSIQVTGGRSQLGLRFPTLLPAWSAPVTGADAYDWNVTSPTAISSVLTLSNASGVSKLNLREVQTGDYLVFEAAASSIPAGVYPVLDVSVSFTGTTLVQSLEIGAAAEPHVFTQQSSSELTFFRPRRATIHQAGGRTVVVAQTQPSRLDVVVPATTQAVGRQVRSAAYLHDGQLLSVAAAQRQGSVVTVMTSEPHGLAVGDQILVDDGFAGTAAPVLTAGDGSTTTDASLATIFTQLDAPTAEASPEATQLLDGRVLVTGGTVSGAAVPTGTMFSVDSSAVTPGGTQYTYSWIESLDMATDRQGHRASILLDGRVLVTGGKDGITYQLNTELFTPSPSGGAWASGPNMGHRRYLHVQVTLDDGRVLVTGGTNNDIVALSSSEIYAPTTNSFGFTGAMATTRIHHRAIKLLDGRVLVTGGVSTPGSAAVHSCEIFNPITNIWSRTGSMTFARARHALALLGDGRVLVVSGVGHRSGETEADVLDAEVWDPSTGCWYPAGRLSTARPGAGAVYLPVKNKVVVVGGAAGAEYFSARTLTWSRLPTGPTSVSGLEAVAAVDDGLVLMTGGGASAWLYQPGEDVYGAGGINGVFGVSAVPGSMSFSYETPDRPGLSTNQNSAITIRAMRALPAGNVVGPFLLDPLEGAAITSIETVATMDIAEGRQYTTLEVVDATQFPDEEGWLAINYGGDTAVYPVRYLGRQSATALMLDYSFKFPTFPNGEAVIRDARVMLLKQKGRYSPEHPEQIGAAYITASSAGRQAAIKALNESVAAGIETVVEVKYPSDIGLGGEGLPIIGQRLSDKVVVWGGDSLQEELDDAREAGNV